MMLIVVLVVLVIKDDFVINRKLLLILVNKLVNIITVLVKYIFIGIRWRLVEEG